jgi:acetylornithine deacetylase/succinyl-diaminopimelate desuccinylase-like protein
MPDALPPVLARIDEQLDEALERLFELLRFKSISTDPVHRQETRATAEWLARDLAAMGFDASVRDTPGHPLVVAHDHAAGADAPHILYYGHYDVQPPDPVDLWETGPFEPTLVDGPHGKRIVARGAVDDKGQLMTIIEALRAWKATHGSLPVRATLMIEGEEESGSPSLDPFLEQHKAELAADVAIISDTGMHDIDTPAITYTLRGLVYVEATLHGPSHDLHSGMYGGAVINPINALTRILAALHDDEGRVQIPGFYEDVRELTDKERDEWAGLGFDEAGFLASAGLTRSVGESGRSLLERIWSRPTCDINGIWGGYTGDGAKTVIPAEASAKISCRLVPEQDPIRVFDGLREFLEQHTPPDCRWTIKPHGVSPAIRVPTQSSFLEATIAALGSTYDKAPVLVGFGLDDDRVHSPNEKFELRCFHMGTRSHAAMLAAFADVPAKQTA